MYKKENIGSSDERKKRNILEMTRIGAKKWASFLLNPRLLLCFAIAWFITNGWSYLAFGLGMYFDIPWMAAVGGTYLGILWIPFTPEKILTVIISFGILKLLFPKDEKTLAIIEEEFRRLREKQNKRRARKKDSPQDASGDKME